MDARRRAGQVVRGRRGRVEAARDREVLGWIARFRFVTVEVLALRFGVSVRRANSRVTALEAAGLVGCRREHGSERRAVFVSRAGALALGLPARRAPRLELQRTHELAICELVARIERARPDALVFSEREGRLLEREAGRRCSVDVLAGGGRQRRWPDVIVELSRSRTAVEIEIAAKSTGRLRGIVAAYAAGGVFGEARFLVASAPLALRLARLCADADRQAPLVVSSPTRLVVAPWPGAPAAEIARIGRALRSVGGARAAD